MYFLVLSQAPPVLAAEIAIWTPDTKDPGNIPANPFGPNNNPKTNGVKITRAPGAIISLRDSLVETAIHLSKSGFLLPAKISPSANCLLTSSTIPLAAFPTDFMVKAEKAYGNIAPNKRPAKISGSVI